MSFRIQRDAVFSNARVQDRYTLPIIDSNDLPPPIVVGLGGGLAFDKTTTRVYFSDGVGWQPLKVDSGSIGNTVELYSFVLGAILPIPTSTPTTLSGLTAPAPYQNMSGWNLVTGVYTTVLINQSFTVNVNITWLPGTNLGTRFLRVRHNGIIIRETRTQADPNAAVETTQELVVQFATSPGDTVNVEVEHDAPIPISIGAGDDSMICGQRVT